MRCIRFLELYIIFEYCLILLRCQYSIAFNVLSLLCYITKWKKGYEQSYLHQYHLCYRCLRIDSSSLFSESMQNCPNGMAYLDCKLDSTVLFVRLLLSVVC